MLNLTYTEEELNEMIHTLNDSMDELELNLNTVEDQPESVQAYNEQFVQLKKINNLLVDLKTYKLK